MMNNEVYENKVKEIYGKFVDKVETTFPREKDTSYPISPVIFLGFIFFGLVVALIVL